MSISSSLLAGMPNIELTDIAKLRWDSISFFLLIFLLSAAGVRWLWNRVSFDFPQLPRITYKTAFCATCLWGLLFLLVLTMISGARELLTPGAWKRSGVLYTLNGPSAPPLSSSNQHEHDWHLEVLRSLLWNYAAAHEGRFPDSIETSGIAPQLWKQPGDVDVSYGYHGGLKMGGPPGDLVFEYQTEDGVLPLALRTDGSIRPVSEKAVGADSSRDSSKGESP